MSKLKIPIDYASLELELRKAIKAEELYKLQNDAKLRAVEQKVPTYEHFRQMVNGAHLRPLEHSDITSKPNGSWNPIINSHNFDETPLSHNLTKQKSETDKTDIIGNKIPKSYEEFIRVWAKMEDPGTKFTYLKNSRSVLRLKVFRIEIPASLFNDIIDVCLKNVGFPDNIEPIVEILTTLSTCNRFRLTLNFMTQDEKAACSHLFHELLIPEECKNKSLKTVIESLAATYAYSSA